MKPPKFTGPKKNHSNDKLSLWTQIRLLFSRSYYYCDRGNIGDFMVVQRWKHIDGKAYLMDEQITDKRNG